MRLSLLGVLVCWLLVLPAWAERIVSAGEAHCRAVRSQQTTSVEMPEPILEIAVIKRPDLFSATHTGPYSISLALSREPSRPGYFVVGHSGSQYQVLCKVATPSDDVVRVTKSAASAQSEAPAVDGCLLAPCPPLPQADSWCAVRGGACSYRGRRAVGHSRRAHRGPRDDGRDGTHAPESHPGSAQARYPSGEPAGSGAEDVLSVESWAWPPRVTVRALAAEHDELSPGMHSRLYVILERRVP